MNKKRMNKIIKIFLVSITAIALVLSGHPPAKIDAAQPGTPSGMGTLKANNGEWARSYDTMGYSLMYSGYTTSVAKGDAAVRRDSDTSSRVYSHGLQIINDGGTLRYLRGSRYIPSWTGGWTWHNQEVVVTPANFTRNNLVRGRSLLDNMYLESGVTRNTLDRNLANGGSAWLNAIIGIRSNKGGLPTMHTGRLWGQGKANFSAPYRVFTQSAGVLAAAWGWSSADTAAIKAIFDISVSMPKIDDTPPDITINPNSDGTWRNATRRVTATASDPGSGVKQMRWRIETNGTWGGWSGWQSKSSLAIDLSGSGKQRVQVQAQDNFNNTGSKESGYFHIDKTAPGGSISANPTAWTNGNVTLTFNATDSGGSGVKRVRQSGGNWVNSSTTTRTVTGNGTYSFEVQDNAGNTNTVSRAVTNIDKTVPNGTISGNPTSWTNQNATLTFKATDSGGSGVKRVRKPNGTWVNGSTTSQSVGSNGTYTFRVEDNAGNARDVSVTVNRIDKTLPNADSTQSPTGWTNGNVNITWTAYATGSPLSGIRTHNGSTWGAWSAVSGTTSSTVQTVTSNGTYHFQVQDAAGNVRQISRNVTNIDKTVPNGTISGNPTSWTNQNATLTFKATDSGGSGVKRVRRPNGTWVNGSTTSQSVGSNGTYTFRVEDNAGNARDVSVTVTLIDKTLPNADSTQSPTGWTNGNVNITWTAYATGSPLSGIRTHNGSTWGAWSAVSGTTSSTVQTVTSNGTYHFQVQDAAGNVRQISRTVVNIDKTLPNMTVTSLNTDWTNTSISIRTAVNDRGDTGNPHHISGVRHIRMRPQGGAWGAWRTFNGASERSSGNLTETWTIDENGTYEWQLQDRAGNIRTASQTVTNIDRIPPATRGSFTPDGWTNQTITITWLADRNGNPGSPLDAYRYDRGNGNWTNWQHATHADAFTVTQDVTENGVYHFDIRDKAGNVARSSVTVTKHDIVLPVGQITARYDRSERDDHVDYTSNDLVDMIDSNRVIVDVTGVEDFGDSSVAGVDFVTIEEQRRIGYGSDWMTVREIDYDWPDPYNTTSQTYAIDVSHAQDTRFVLTVTDRAGNESSRVASNVVRQSVLQAVDFRITDVVNPQLSEDELAAIRASDLSEGVVELTAGTNVTFDVTYQLRHLDTVDELSGAITIKTISDDRTHTHVIDVEEPLTGHNQNVTFTKTFTVPQGTPKGSEITIVGNLKAKLANGTTHDISYPSTADIGVIDSHIEEFFRFRIVR